MADASGWSLYASQVIHSTVYVSTMVTPLSRAELDELLIRSQRNNARDDITGLLLYRGGRVMQVLEGPPGPVESLYHRISTDPRHHSVTRVWTSSSDQRRFPTWSMGLDDLDSPTGAATGHSVEPDSRARSIEDDLLHSMVNPAVSDISDAAIEQRQLVARRAAVLRRALASGDRLITALAVILHGHNPQQSLGANGTYLINCGQCRAQPGPESTGNYPCSTANNALWALDAVLR